MKSPAGPDLSSSAGVPAAAQPAGPELQGMDVRLIDSIVWTAAGKWGTQLISWACFLIVARLLSPGDYGLLGMTTVYLGLVALLSEFGIGSAVVNLRDLTAGQIRQLNTLSLLLAGAAVGLSLLAARPLAAFFNAPELPLVVMVMSTGFLVSGLRAVPHASLQRDLRFRFLAAVESGQTVVQAVITVVLAALGAGYWALVAGGLLGPATGAVCMLAVRRTGFAWPQRQSLRRALSFSWAVLVANVCWYAYANADFTVAGKVLGKSALGFYTLAWTIATLPGQKITSLVVRVTPGFFSACRQDPAALRRYVCRLTEAITMITVPAILGIAVVAPDLVPVVLGAKWEPSVAPLTLLCIFTAVSSGISMFPQILNAMGRERLGMWNSILKVMVLPPAFYIGSHWGGTGIAAAWLITYPPLNLPLYWWGFRAIQMRPGEYLRALRPSWSGALVMSAAVLLFRSLTGSWPAGLRLGLEVATGVAAYLLVLLTFQRERTRGYLQVVLKWKREGFSRQQR